jgi:hypothetical protein
MYAVTPPNLRADFESSTPETRAEIVAEAGRLIGSGISRDEVLAKITGAGWSVEFASWIYTKVKHYGQVEIMPPTEERVRKPVMVFSWKKTLVAVVVMLVIFFLGNPILAPLGLIVYPSWGFFERWFLPQDSGQSKWSK